MITWVYRDLRINAGCYTVGFYDPDGVWQPESDHKTMREAAKRVRYLNGGSVETEEEHKWNWETNPYYLED